VLRKHFVLEVNKKNAWITALIVALALLQMGIFNRGRFAVSVTDGCSVVLLYRIWPW
jgi:hypothetical protein